MTGSIFKFENQMGKMYRYTYKTSPLDSNAQVVVLEVMLNLGKFKIGGVSGRTSER
jgi:UDP-N-acetylenolpyruvoylglucosamine reductase